MSPRRSPTWRDPILAHFTPEIASAARLTIVADPDQLFTEHGVLLGIRQRGFELIPFEDHIAFRYAFETRFRQVWDRGEDTNLVVALRATRRDVESLPFDLLEHARHDRRLLSFSIAEVFPNLAPKVVAELERTDFDALHEAQRAHTPSPLGENATRDFILRHVFDITPEALCSSTDLLHTLLRRHHRGWSLPPSIEGRLVDLLEATGRWSDWPLREIVTSCPDFLALLEEQWPLFLERVASRSDSVGEPRANYGLRFDIPEPIPFEHPDIRVYVDSLFLEGHLTPSRAVPKSAAEGKWYAVGISGDAKTDALERLERLLDKVEAELAELSPTHLAWIHLATQWAELVAMRCQLPPESLEDLLPRITALHDRIEEAFGTWMLEHYGPLHNLAFLPRPAMVHHIPRYLAHTLRQSPPPAPSPCKLALLVIDGLSLDQWSLLRDDLWATGTFETDDAAVFAWVPTLTSVSRQAIFSGELPLYFARSIHSTHKEESHWRRFWEDEGIRRSEIAYLCQKKQEPDEDFLERLRQQAEHPKVRILGAVVGTIDQTMHGTSMGTGGMHASVRHWASSGHFRALIRLLTEHRFEVFLTADHGNLEATGMGKPNVGSLAEERGERVHVFPEERLREAARKDFPDAILWPPIGIPDGYHPLLAPRRQAFLTEGKRTVAHGGIGLEEVIVPFVRVLPKS